MSESNTPDMIEAQVSDLTGPALDWAVAEAECWNHPNLASPSTDWVFGGSLLDKMMASGKWQITPQGGGKGAMVSNTDSECMPINGDCNQENITAYGETLLIAACRAYVIDALGDAVSVPAMLMEEKR